MPDILKFKPMTGENAVAASSLVTPNVPRTRSKEYRCYIRMIHRCHNKDYPGYENYGKRGIKVCKRWRESFEYFLADVGPAPSPQHTLDRKDNDKGYSKANCRWATWKVQANNRRTNNVIEFAGLTKTMAEWADYIGGGCTRKKLWKRIKLGWPMDRVLSPLPLPLPATAAPQKQAA